MDDAERETLARQYHERLDFELGVIIGIAFPGHVLIVADSIKRAPSSMA